MNRGSPFEKLVLACLAWVTVSCIYDFPAGISDAEVRQLGVTQGVAGKAYLKEGVCSPGCTNCLPGTCALGPIPGKLIVLSGAAPVGGRTEDGGIDFIACPSRLYASVPHPGIPVSSFLSRQVATTSLQSGQFGLPLDAGDYVLLVADSAGCADCVGWTNLASGALGCAHTTVESDQVTKIDILLDVSVW